MSKMRLSLLTVVLLAGSSIVHAGTILVPSDQPTIQAGIDATCQLVQGTTIDSILLETDKVAADLVIIGAHKHGKLHNLLFGNIHEAIVEQTNCPILIVPCHKLKEDKNAD